MGRQAAEVGRRPVLKLLGAAGGLPLLLGAGEGRAEGSAPDLLVLVLSDLHSAYERAPQALALLDRLIARAVGVPALVVVNGDVFERGNAVALRSRGAPDWLFLEALARRAPVVLNLGNHETAIEDRMGEVANRIRSLGITVVSNMADAATGEPFAPPSAEVRVGSRRVVVAGLCTDDRDTYRQAVRASLRLPEPAAYARERLPDLLRGADAAIVLSHAGVAADRRILPLLPDGALLVGGHEHLRLSHERGATRYLHVGSWNRFVAAVRIRFGAGGPTLDVEEHPVDPAGPADPALAAAVAEARERHFAPGDREVVGRLPAPLDLPDAARLLCRAMARASGAEVGMVSHTSLGAGLPGGEVTRYSVDAFLRFDGELMAAEMDADALRGILAIADQDGPVALERHRGDFVYTNTGGRVRGERVRVVTTGWVRQNAARYLGRSDIPFESVTGLRLKGLLAAALRAG